MFGFIKRIVSLFSSKSENADIAIPAHPNHQAAIIAADRIRAARLRAAGLANQAAIIDARCDAMQNGSTLGLADLLRKGIDVNDALFILS